MVHLTTVNGAFHAQVVAARLGADGILTQLRGAVGTTYPFVGEVQVYVSEEEAEAAREILLADQVEAALAGVEGEAGEDDEEVARGPARRRSRRVWLVVTTAVLLACIFLGARGL